MLWQQSSGHCSSDPVTQSRKYLVLKEKFANILPELIWAQQGKICTERQYPRLAVFGGHSSLVGWTMNHCFPEQAPPLICLLLPPCGGSGPLSGQGARYSWAYFIFVFFLSQRIPVLCLFCPKTCLMSEKTMLFYTFCVAFLWLKTDITPVVV